MTLPLGGGPAPLWVDRAEGVVALCELARKAGTLAVDTEADSFHSYHHKLCLLQVSSAGTHALLDPFSLGTDGLAPLVEILAEPGLRKVFHGADYDLRILDRDLGARVRGLADTQVAAQLLGEPHTALASLLEKELGIKVDKNLQRADWSVRPLSPAHCAYAAADTAYLEPLLARLLTRLRLLGRLGWWEEECLSLGDVRYQPPPVDVFAFERIKGGRALKGAARDRLAALYAWREAVAAAADLAPFKVLRGDVMLRLAHEAPADLATLARVPGVGQANVRRYGRRLVDLLRQPPPAPERDRPARPPVDQVFEERVKAARAVRDQRARELELQPGVLAPRERLEAVVRCLPANEEELARCLERRWRAAVLGEGLLGLTAQWRRLCLDSHERPPG